MAASTVSDIAIVVRIYKPIARDFLLSLMNEKVAINAGRTLKIKKLETKSKEMRKNDSLKIRQNVVLLASREGCDVFLRDVANI